MIENKTPQLYGTITQSSGGTNNYNDLNNIPSINEVPLKGDLTTEDLGIEIPDTSKFITREVSDLENYYDRTKTDELLDEKQPTGDYALKSELPNIEGLATEEYVDDKAEEVEGKIPDVSSFITKDVNDLTNYVLKANTGTNISLSIDPSTYVLTFSLNNESGEVLSTKEVDLPLETMVIGADYDNDTKEIVLTLQNGNTTRFSVADLVSGLVTNANLSQTLNDYIKESDVSYITNEEIDDMFDEAHNWEVTSQNIQGCITTITKECACGETKTDRIENHEEILDERRSDEEYDVYVCKNCGKTLREVYIGEE